MKTIGAFEAKTHLSSLLQQVERGDEITITRHGRAVARLVPVHHRSNDERQDVAARIKAFRKGRRLGKASIKSLIEEGRR